MNHLPKPVFVLRPLALLIVISGVLLCLWLRQKSLPPLEPPSHQEQLNKDLITAIYDEDTPAVVSLLRRGADPNARGYWDREGRWDETRQQRVWEPRRNTGGPTALMLAVFTGRIETVRALLATGIDVNTHDGAGNTALIYAGLYGSTQISLLLLDHGADVSPCSDGESALYYAVETGHTDLVSRILAHGAQINARNASGDTALMCVAAVPDSPMVRLLLEKGAAVNVRNNAGETALLMAVEAHGGAERVGDAIMDRANVSPVEKQETVRALLHKGADATIRDNTGRTVLQAVREPCRAEILDLLRQTAPIKLSPRNRGPGGKTAQPHHRAFGPKSAL